MTGVSAHPEVVHVVQRFAPGGIETLVRDLVSCDPQRTLIISLEGTTEELVRAWPGIAPLQQRIIGLDRKPGLSVGLIQHLSQVLRQLRPKTLFAHHIGPLFYAGIAARLAGIPTIIHVEHDVWHYTSLPRARDLTRLIEYVVRPRHVAVSRHAADEIRAFLPRADVTVIHNGIDTELFHPADKFAARAKYELPHNKRIVGTAGRLVEVKGHAVLLRAAVLLSDDIHIAIAGDGICRKDLEATAVGLGISNRVTFLGHVDGVNDLLPAFDVFCLPSLAEGFPRSVIEAQSCGIPVVASSVGALDEAVHRAALSLVPPGDQLALARALNRALKRQDFRDVRQFVAERFTWNATVNLYRSLAESAHVG